jgi:hypothetical protein
MPQNRIRGRLSRNKHPELQAAVKAGFGPAFSSRIKGFAKTSRLDGGLERAIVLNEDGAVTVNSQPLAGQHSADQQQTAANG